MDNYYNSVQLTKNLYELNTTVCGTIRQNRGLPKDFRNQQMGLKRGEMTFGLEGELFLVSWMDKKLISTIHSAEMVKIPSKFGRNEMKPECIADYNQCMHGVGTADQYLALYPFIRKTCKWPKKCSFIYFSVHFSILSVFFENLTPNQISRFFSSCKH
jgi:hypothetical protein